MREKFVRKFRITRSSSKWGQETMNENTELTGKNKPLYHQGGIIMEVTTVRPDYCPVF